MLGRRSTRAVICNPHGETIWWGAGVHTVSNGPPKCAFHPLHLIVSLLSHTQFHTFERRHQSHNQKQKVKKQKRINSCSQQSVSYIKFHFRRRSFGLVRARSQLMVRNYIKKGNHGGGGRNAGLPPAYWDEQGGREAAAEAKRKREEEAAANEKADDDKRKADWMAMVARSKKQKKESTTEEAEDPLRRSPRKHAASSSAASSSAQDAESSAQSGA